jgi:hypothetical protein
MALEALHTAPAGKAAAAARWLGAQQQSTGSWVDQGGPNVDSTGLAAAALDAAGRDAGTARAWLASQQVTAGPTVGAGASRGALQFEGKFDAATAVKATSDGMLGMVPHGSLATLTDAHATPGTALLALAPATLSGSRAQRGQTVRVSGTGFSRGEPVRIRLANARVASGTAGADGSVSVRLTVPGSAPLGRQPVTLTGVHSLLSSSTALVVRAQAAAPSSPAPTPTPTPTAPSGGEPVLAATGPSHLGALVAGGAGFVVLGGLALRVGRRRRA